MDKKVIFKHLFLWKNEKTSLLEALKSFRGFNSPKKIMIHLTYLSILFLIKDRDFISVLVEIRCSTLLGLPYNI